MFIEWPTEEIDDLKNLKNLECSYLIEDDGFTGYMWGPGRLINHECKHPVRYSGIKQKLFNFSNVKQSWHYTDLTPDDHIFEKNSEIVLNYFENDDEQDNFFECTCNNCMGGGSRVGMKRKVEIVT